MSILNEAAYPKAPIAGRVIRIAVDDSVDRFVIPAGFDGQFCRFELEVADADEPAEADIVFGGSTVSCTRGQASSVDGSGNITVNAASGLTLRSGRPDVWVMPTADTATHFAVDCDASLTGATLVISKS